MFGTAKLSLPAWLNFGYLQGKLLATDANALIGD
jgi:hypothetical protein